MADLLRGERALHVCPVDSLVGVSVPGWEKVRSRGAEPPIRGCGRPCPGLGRVGSGVGKVRSEGAAPPVPGWEGPSPKAEGGDPGSRPPASGCGLRWSGEEIPRASKWIPRYGCLLPPRVRLNFYYTRVPGGWGETPAGRGRHPAGAGGRGARASPPVGGNGFAQLAGAGWGAGAASSGASSPFTRHPLRMRMSRLSWAAAGSPLKVSRGGSRDSGGAGMVAEERRLRSSWVLLRSGGTWTGRWL